MEHFEEILRERFLLQREFLGTDKPVNKVNPIVSVTVATYQQVAYIRQCLDGILMQKTNFPIEIIIGEDGSVDGTKEICEEYARNNPDKIRLFNRDRTLSQYESTGKVYRFNGHWNRMSARGKYIAWCEGDDYWIDPLKLQKQVDFLESHPDYGLVHTLAKVYIEKEKIFRGRTIGEGFENVDSLIIRNRVATLTTCYRSELYWNYRNEILCSHCWKMGDYPFWIYLALNSNVHFLNDVTAVYRVLENSASHSDDVDKEISFCKSVYDISTYFAKESDKQYLLPKIKRNFLHSVIHLYANKNRKLDKRIVHLVKKIRCASVKTLILLILLNTKRGRKCLKTQ